MKQLIQDLDSGQVRVVEVPAPGVRPGFVLVRTVVSLVSAGTERMIADFAAKNLVQKARARPDLVRQVWEKARRDGLLTTLEAARNRLEQPMALGYASAGIVLAVGDGCEGLRPGDRVACGGGGHAVHAEIVAVPRNLVVSLPDTVDFETGAFATLGAIALQGIRLAGVEPGAVVGVIGLGLLGQLACQLLTAAGCRVVGTDLRSDRVALARQTGSAETTTDPTAFVALCRQRGGGHGADAVLITADTRSDGPVTLAAEAARLKGTVVAVGAVGLNLPRRLYYEKELAFYVSRSYGPGRYDPTYEEEGRDYPYAYVRWTEQRNMAAFVDLAAQGRLDVQPLISHRFPLTEAPRAYDLVTGRVAEPYLAILLTYPETPDPTRRVVLAPLPAVRAADVSPRPTVRLGVLGAGNYAISTLLPALKDLPGLERVGIASSGGLSASSAGRRFGFGFAATGEEAILGDERINTVAILTRHNAHARQVLAALAAGKHVFVEKPLCLTEAELATIAGYYAGLDPAPMLMVGFNRRFAPLVVTLKTHLAAIAEPLYVACRVNAGYLPPDHWLHDPTVGGGRLVGEGCHFVDLLLHLLPGEPVRVTARALPDGGRYRQDNVVVTLECADGSLGVLSYLANGNRRLGKERIEVFGGGWSAVLDDYRTLSIHGPGRSVQRRAWLRQDKGHRAEWEAIVAHLTAAAAPPIPPAVLFRSMQVTFAAQRSLVTGEPVFLPDGATHA
ncbi:MAG: bi-domain-containing oxidoreductase [Caldilineales bacterium]|nr:bi-domain-containing oxidoreductase [Caldilineales bacterium]